MLSTSCRLVVIYIIQFSIFIRVFAVRQFVLKRLNITDFFRKCNLTDHFKKTAIFIGVNYSKLIQSAVDIQQCHHERRKRSELISDLIVNIIPSKFVNKTIVSQLVVEAEDFISRGYQDELLKVCVEKNTIIYLPTGSGKTFIAIMAVKHFSPDLLA